MDGMQEDWVASIPSMDLQIFIDAVDYSFPLPASPAGPELGDKVLGDAHRGLEAEASARTKSVCERTRPPTPR